MSTVTRTITAMENTYKICRICLKPADIKITGRQKNAFVMEGKHDDGTVHTWLKYNTMDLNAKKPGKKVNRIECPKCGDEGIVNQYRPNSRNPLKTAYVVVHEKIPGRWGKGDEMQKRRRCYIHKKEWMDAINKKIGRYVAPS